MKKTGRGYDYEAGDKVIRIEADRRCKTPQGYVRYVAIISVDGAHYVAHLPDKVQRNPGTIAAFAAKIGLALDADANQPASPYRRFTLASPMKAHAPQIA